MKAAVIEHLGDRGAIVEVAEPRPGPRELLVKVVAAGVNPIDWKVAERAERAMPFVLGQDFAGVVVDVGNSVRRYRNADRVFGIARDHGSYAQYTVVPEDDPAQPVAKIPDGVGDADAAALPTAGLTALASIEALHVRSGTALLVLGATGGVGSFAVQMAHDRGARIIGTAKAQNEALALSLGVDEFVAYDRDDMLAVLAKSHPNGADAVLDLVDDADALKRIANAVRPGGRVVSTIGAADVSWFAQRKIEAQNLVMAKTPQSSHEGLRTLAGMLESGRLRVLIGAEHNLTDAVTALEQSRSGTTKGKMVLTV